MLHQKLLYWVYVYVYVYVYIYVYVYVYVYIKNNIPKYKDILNKRGENIMKSKKDILSKKGKKQKSKKPILHKIEKSSFLLGHYCAYAISYHLKCGDYQTFERIFNDLEKIENFDQFRNYIPRFWIEECPLKIIQKCPHITFDKTKIIFPSKLEIDRKLEINNRYFNNDRIKDSDDRYVIDSKAGNEFLRWKLCYKKQKVPWLTNENKKGDDDDIIPWCMNDKGPACCCNCTLCDSLPINIKCNFTEFLEHLKIIDYLRQRVYKYHNRRGENDQTILDEMNRLLYKLMAFDVVNNNNDNNNNNN